MIRKDGFFFIKSPIKTKKYRVFHPGGVTDFGAIKNNGEVYSQFNDSIGLYKEYNNNNIKKRENYYKRHNIDYPEYSSDWFSKKYLW